MEVAIIILTWNGKADTLECLHSLQKLKYSRCRLIVVDNGSTDGTVEAVRAQFPEVYLIENGKNLGYSEGNNKGLLYALSTEAKYFLLLNNDTVVSDNFLEPLVNYAEAHPEAGILGSKVYQYGTQDRIWFCGAYINSNARLLHFGYKEVDSFNQLPSESVYIPGCSLMIRRDLLEKIGFLDHEFFAYFEDVDWCLKAKRLGYLIMVIPESVIWHKEAKTLGKESPRYLYYNIRNKLRIFQRHSKGVVKFKWFFYAYLDNYQDWKFYSDRASAGDLERAKAIQFGVLDFWRNRFGEPHYPWLSLDRPNFKN